MKTVSKVLLILAAAIPAFAAGPAWDSSGNGLLNGTYYFRQVVYQFSQSEAYTYYGNISFNGSGTYTVAAGATFVAYTGSVPNVSISTAAATGTYSVSSSGYGFMSSTVGLTANIVFLVSNGIVVGSETENTAGVNDMFVAAPLSTSLSLSSLTGTYTIASMFTNYDATFLLTPGSTGTIGNVSISGYNSSTGAAATQNSSGVKIAYSNGAYSISFPTNTSAIFYTGGTPTANAPGNTGSLFLYSSPDSKFVFGGTQYGFDMFVGVQNAPTGTSTPLSAGLYYEAGIDNNAAAGLDTYYGTFNNIPGNSTNNSIIGHQRLLSAGSVPEGFTYYDSAPTIITGGYTNPTAEVNYTVSQNGIRIGYGTAGYPAISVALPYSPPAPTRSVYLDPTGVVNSASSAPYTAGISPGDFITLYNITLPGVSGLSVSTTLPTLGTSIGGVTVSVDGIAAPLYYITPTSLSFVVPSAVGAVPIASIQISDNGVFSNIVTTYVNKTTPGVFTFPAGGIGVAAMVDYPASGAPFVVGTNNPANAGDTVALFLTGLGTPFPPNPGGDGAPGGTGCLSGSCLLNDISVDVSGISVPASNILFAGQAPQEVSGLYQINFTMPALCAASGQTGCINSGTNSIGILGPDSYTDESYIPVSSVGASALPSQTSPDATLTKTTSAARKTLPRFSNTANR